MTELPSKVANENIPKKSKTALTKEYNCRLEKKPNKIGFLHFQFVYQLCRLGRALSLGFENRQATENIFHADQKFMTGTTKEPTFGAPSHTNPYSGRGWFFSLG